MANGTLIIQAGLDDGRENTSTGGIDLTANTLDVGKNRITALRFTNVAIPQASTITSAKIRFFGKTSNNQVITIKYQAEDVDDSAALVTTSGDMTARVKTTASVSDTPANWTDEAYNDGPDIMTVIQEVIDRGGWTSGNALTVFIMDDGSTGNQRRPAAFEHSTADSEPQLVVMFIVPPPAGAGGGGSLLAVGLLFD